MCLRVDELEKETRVPLGELPLPRGIEAGPRQLDSALSINERPPGNDRESGEIRASQSVSFTAQESDQLPVMPGLRSCSRARDGAPAGS